VQKVGQAVHTLLRIEYPGKHAVQVAESSFIVMQLFLLATHTEVDAFEAIGTK
jgi:hypothetical protein